MKRLPIVLAATTAILIGNVARAQEQVGVPEEIAKELSYLVGTWKFEGKIGDDVMAGTVSYSWARSKEKEKYSLVENWSYKEGDTSVTGISLMGWNAAKKCLVEVGFNSAGSCFQTWWTVKSPTEWRGEFADVEEGKEVEGKGVVIKKGSGEFVYEGETTAGETGRLVFRKVTKERKPRKAKEAKE